jgi:hypothetical protein
MRDVAGPQVTGGHVRASGTRAHAVDVGRAQRAPELRVAAMSSEGGLHPGGVQTPLANHANIGRIAPLRRPIESGRTNTSSTPTSEISRTLGSHVLLPARCGPTSQRMPSDTHPTDMARPAD